MDRVVAHEGEFQISDENRVTLQYQAAISLWTSAGQDIWSRINAMLVSNTIITACIGFGVASDIRSFWYYAPLALVGLLACLLFASLFSRGWAYHNYYLLSARELEEKHMNACKSNLIDGGRALAQNKRVTVSRQEVRFGLMAKLPASLAAYCLVALFFMLYVSAFFVHLLPASTTK